MANKAVIDSSPLAVGLSKKSIDDCYGKDTTLGHEIETLVSSQLLLTKDAKAGPIYRMHKKKPEWKWK